MTAEKKLKVNDSLTLKVEDGLLQAYVQGRLIPLEKLVDDVISLINENFQLYCRIYERHGREFKFRDRGWLDIEFGERLPAWFMFIKIEKKSKDIMNKLVVPLILRGNLRSLLFCYSEDYLFLLDLFTITDRVKEVMVTQLVSGVQTKDKWIFNLSFNALTTLSFGSLSKKDEKTIFTKTIKLEDHLRLKEHIGEDNFEEFLIIVSENLLEFYDPNLFYYHIDILTKFFTSFGSHAYEGLNTIYQNSSGELQSIAEKSLLQIQAKDYSISLELDKNITIDRLKELDVKEIKTLIPKNTGKIVVESVIEELSQDTQSERLGDHYGIGVNLFRNLAKDSEISYNDGVKTIFLTNDLDKLELLIDLEVFEHLVPKEIISLFQSVPIDNIMNLLLILDKRDIKIRGSQSEIEDYWKRDSYYYGLEWVSKFFEATKSHLSKLMETQLLAKLAEKPLDFSRNVVKFHILENPTPNDLLSLLQSPMNQSEIIGSNNYLFFQPFFEKIAQNIELFGATLRKIVEGKNIEALRGIIASEILFGLEPEQFSPFLGEELYEALSSAAKYRDIAEWNYGRLESLSYFFKKLSRTQYNAIAESIKDLFISQNIEGISFATVIPIISDLHKKTQIELIKNPKFHFFKNFGRIMNGKNYSTYYDYDYVHNLFDTLKTLIDKEDVITSIKNDNYFEMSCVVNQALIDLLSNEDLENLPDTSKLILIKNLIVALDFPDEMGIIYPSICKYLDQFQIKWQELFNKTLYELFLRSSPEIISVLLEPERLFYESLEAKDVERLLSPSDTPNEIQTYFTEALKKKGKYNYELLNFFLFVYNLGLEKKIHEFFNRLPSELREIFGLQLNRVANSFDVSTKEEISKLIELIGGS